MDHSEEWAEQPTGTDGPAPRPTGLTPFTAGDPRAREAALKSAQVRKARRAAVRADALAIAAHLRTLVDTAERGPTIGSAAHAVALDMIGRIGRGEVPIRNGSEAADLVRVLVDVARLDAGQATSAALVVHASAGRADGAAELRRRARAALVAAAADVTADNEDPGGVVLDVGEVEDPPRG